MTITRTSTIWLIWQKKGEMIDSIDSVWQFKKVIYIFISRFVGCINYRCPTSSCFPFWSLSKLKHSLCTCVSIISGGRRWWWQRASTIYHLLQHSVSLSLSVSLNSLIVRLLDVLLGPITIRKSATLFFVDFIPINLIIITLPVSIWSISLSLISVCVHSLVLHIIFLFDFHYLFWNLPRPRASSDVRLYQHGGGSELLLNAGKDRKRLDDIIHIIFLSIHSTYRYYIIHYIYSILNDVFPLHSRYTHYQIGTKTILKTHPYMIVPSLSLSLLSLDLLFNLSIHQPVTCLGIFLNKLIHNQHVNEIDEWLIIPNTSIYKRRMNRIRLLVDCYQAAGTRMNPSLLASQ